MSNFFIHPTAVVETNEIGDGTYIGPFTYISKRVTIGKNCKIYNASIGLPGEHPNGADDLGGKVVISDDVEIREFVTINAPLFSYSTFVGAGSYLMTKSHVGHDAMLGDRVVLHTGAVVGGHSYIGKYCYLGLNCSTHPHAALGDFCLVGANGLFKGKSPAGLIWAGVPAIPLKINKVGLERHALTAGRSKYGIERIANNAHKFILEWGHKLFLLLSITTYNEEGHIAEQLDNALQLGCYDAIVILDDGSTDNTYNIISDYSNKYNTIHVFRNEVNSILSNGENRWVTISNIIRDFNPVWVNNRAADVLYPHNCGQQLKGQLEKLVERPTQLVGFPWIHFWRSDFFHRMDHDWGSGFYRHTENVIWRFNKEFKWHETHLKAGMHQGMARPTNLGWSDNYKTIGINFDLITDDADRNKDPFPIIGLHYGMSSHDKITEKFHWVVKSADAASKIGRSFGMPTAKQNAPS